MNCTIYAYIRISTNHQKVDSQINEIITYCKENNYILKPENMVVDEGRSGSIKWRDRKINDIMNKIVKNDVIIVPELSRLGRNMNEVQEIIAICVEIKVKIIDIKNKFNVDGTFTNGLMATFYTMFSQMEKEIISQRVKAGLKVAREKGHLIGRKRGIKKNKLDGKDNEIIELAKMGSSYLKMSEVLNVGAYQIRQYMIKKDLFKYYCYTRPKKEV